MNLFKLYPNNFLINKTTELHTQLFTVIFILLCFIVFFNFIVYETEKSFICDCFEIILRDI